MNMTPCLYLFSALSTSPVPPTEALLHEIAADSRMHTGLCRAYATRAAPLSADVRTHDARLAEVHRSAAPTPVPQREHALAVALLRAFPGISAAEATVYRHIRDNADMTPEEQESLQALLGDGCPMMDYFRLGESLVAGLAEAGPDAPQAAAAREVIVANALRDVQRQPHTVGMVVHVALLDLLHEQHLLRHVKAQEGLAHVHDLIDSVRAASRGPVRDLRTQILQAEPLRDALLTFLLAEASA